MCKDKRSRERARGLELYGRELKSNEDKDAKL